MSSSSSQESLTFEVRNLKTILAEKNKEKEELDSLLKDTQNSIQHSLSEIESLKNELSLKEEALQNYLSQPPLDPLLSPQYKELKKELNETLKRFETQKAAIDELEGKVGTFEAEKSRLEEALQESISIRTTLNEKIDSLFKSLFLKESALDKALKQLQTFDDDNEALRNQIVELHQLCSEKDSVLTQLTGEIQTLKENNQKLAATLVPESSSQVDQLERNSQEMTETPPSRFLSEYHLLRKQLSSSLQTLKQLKTEKSSLLSQLQSFESIQTLSNTTQSNEQVVQALQTQLQDKLAQVTIEQPFTQDLTTTEVSQFYGPLADLTNDREVERSDEKNTELNRLLKKAIENEKLLRLQNKTLLNEIHRSFRENPTLSDFTYLKNTVLRFIGADPSQKLEFAGVLTNLLRLTEEEQELVTAKLSGKPASMFNFSLW